MKMNHLGMYIMSAVGAYSQPTSSAPGLLAPAASSSLTVATASSLSSALPPFQTIPTTINEIFVPNPADDTSNSESNQTSDNLFLIEQLQGAPTAVERLAKLNNGSDWVFDFNFPAGSGAVTQSQGGHTVKADRLGFPALIGTGVSMTLGFLGPCGFNTPHTHPRSAEINVVVQGSLIAQFVAENGAAVIKNQLNQYQMTVFPQGALHTEFNPDCTPAVFVAGFANEDPGVQQAAQSLFELDDDIIQAAFNNDFTFNGADIDQFKALIPKNVALGVESCLAKCNILKRK